MLCVRSSQTVTQWDFQNKEDSGCTGTSSFVMKVPLCNLRLSMADLYQVPFKGPIDIYKVEEEILNVILLGKQENNPHSR